MRGKEIRNKHRSVVQELSQTHLRLQQFETDGANRM